MPSPQSPPEEESAQSEIAGLTARLSHYPLSRYPVQHATTAFRLATLHLAAGRLSVAVPLLRTARDVFSRLGMRLEETKALNLLGITQRDGGRPDLAVLDFTQAAAAFGQLGQHAEQAAASYNLGLSLGDLGDLGDAQAAEGAFLRAHELFLAAGHPAQAGAAARERGALLLTSGAVERALEALEDAVSLADRSGDLPGLGAAANALGLAHLAADNPAAAIPEFSRAVGAFPRSMRAREHAMAKANLAVASERAGQPARARLAARQALAISAADPPVRAQAKGLLSRLGAVEAGDLLSVLAREPAEQWAATIREEMRRWCDSSPSERAAGLLGFLSGLLDRPGTSSDLAAGLVSALVELPPDPYDLLVASIVEVTAGLGPADVETVRSIVGSAMARLALPQWQRLASHLNSASSAAGLPVTWS